MCKYTKFPKVRLQIYPHPETLQNFTTADYTREQQVLFISLFRYKTHQKHPEKQLMNLGNNPRLLDCPGAVAIEEAGKQA